jgi:glutamate synthase domain-containing protein 3
VDGGLKFSRDILIGAILGADEFGFGTASLLAIGCVMARQCHLNTCPVGIATQDETLRLRFNGKPEMVIAYFRALADEIRRKLAELGANSLSELKGAYDCLRPRDPNYAETPALALESNMSFRIAPQQVPGLHASLGDLHAPEVDLESESQSSLIRNSDRSLGAGLSGEMARDRAAGRASRSAIAREFHGSAGQSFGAFLGAGIDFKLDGEANDYVGKGLSGGTIAITAGVGASRRGDVLAGNTVLYGATSGQLFVAGRAGERFAIRNSGALAVVEGVGQHGCEYMTGGVVLVLGPLGLNFGSGMTGGLAYVLRAEAEDVLHRDFVSTEEITSSEDAWLRQTLRQHLDRTGSPRAARLLSRRGLLPMLRVQPVHLQGTVQSVWEPVLAHLKPEFLTIAEPQPAVAAAHAVSV